MTTESDRELLELAAKASGIPIIPCTCRHERWPFKHDEARSGKSGHWNPLENDGDALRLAVKLGITIYTNICTAYVMYGNQPINADEREITEVEDPNGDPQAATRRAIVRAAAEIRRTL